MKGANFCVSFFVSAQTYMTPDLIEELCYQYNKAIQKAEIDPLLLISCFILFIRLVTEMGGCPTC